MGTFTNADGLGLAYHGEADNPLVCLAGGPMQDSTYLAGLPLPDVIRMDLRGTGDSDEASVYGVDHQVADVDALRRHLGLERIRLLGHSAGGTLAVLYATRYPGRVEELVLVAPSPFVVGIDVSDDDRRAVALRRSGEPWYAEAIAGFEEMWAGRPTPEAFAKITPFFHGRWDDAARAVDAHPRHPKAAMEYYKEATFDPAKVREKVRKLDVPTLLVAGELDVSLPPDRAREYADLFPRATLVVQPGAAHFPWVDDPGAFAATVQRMP
ncbi:alpha/beta hydrolase [Lentzea sp. NPDC003310]|uniref:alpha/beta fold hydrolase n=1 Tax=Lentzea sp. NPDC003310 TaxID=3154447 RepID=UPI0033B16328